MPNFYFMTVQFFHLLALCLWVGGIFSIAFLMAPVIFQKVDSKRKAGGIVERIFALFNKLTLACIITLIFTSVIKYVSWENPTPWIISRYFFIGSMSVSALYLQFGLFPRMNAVKKKIAVFDQLPEDNINQQNFNILHRQSRILFLLNLVFGLAVLFLT